MVKNSIKATVSFFNALTREPYLYLLRYIYVAITFSILYYMNPDAIVDQDGNQLEGFEFVYFSIVTITTLGYGDYLPAGTLGQVLVSLEVMLGILIIGFFMVSIGHALSSRYAELQEKTRRIDIIELLAPTNYEIAHTIYELLKMFFLIDSKTGRASEKFTFVFGASHVLTIRRISVTKDSMMERLSKNNLDYSDVASELERAVLSIEDMLLGKYHMIPPKLLIMIQGIVSEVEKREKILKNKFEVDTQLDNMGVCIDDFSLIDVEQILYSALKSFAALLVELLNGTNSGYKYEDWTRLTEISIFTDQYFDELKKMQSKRILASKVIRRNMAHPDL